MKIKSLVIFVTLLAGTPGCEIHSTPVRPIPGDTEFVAGDTEFVEPICEPKCESGWQCISERCVEVIAADQASPQAIVADDTYLYWINKGTFDMWDNYADDGAIVRATKNGDELVTLASDQYFPVQITLDNTHVYWITGYDSNSSTNIMRVTKDGTGAPEIVFEVETEMRVVGLAVGATNFYVASHPYTWGASVTTDVWQIPKDLSTSATVMFQEPVDLDGLEISSEHLVWHFYAGEEDLVYIRSTPLSGPYQPVDLQRIGDSVNVVSVANTDLFWSTGGSIYKGAVDNSEGGATCLGESEGGNDSQILADSESIYWAATVDGTNSDEGWFWTYVIKRAPLVPGPGATRWDGLRTPGDKDRPITVDESYIYAIHNSSILKLDK